MKRLYFDMDDVLVDFMSGVKKLDAETREKYKDHWDDIPNIFSKMEPVEGSQNAVEVLSQHFDCYILSTSPWNNPTAASDKIAWIKKYYPKTFHKKVVLSHRKDLCKGDFLIDDQTSKGAADFEGELIQFKTDRFPDWNTVIAYLLENK